VSRSHREPGETDSVDIGVSLRRLLALLLLGAVLFGVGVSVAELQGELGLDVDLKPFFVVYLPVAVFAFGAPTLALGLGAAMGEGAHDIAEGYEPDEPLGFVGFVVGFALFGYILHRVAPDPTDRRYQVGAAVLAGFVQAVFEGFAFLFDRGFTATEAVISVAGNTVTHGLVLGAIPLVLLYPVVTSGRWLFPATTEGVRVLVTSSTRRRDVDEDRSE
jgi:hypothetical protein